MSNLLESITAQLDGQALQSLASQIGADEGTTKKAVGLALPLLIAQMDRNTDDPKGAASLASALDKDHDASLLGNVSGFLSNPQDAIGQGILGHILGGKQGKVEQGVGKATGLDMSQVTRLLKLLAPILMSALAKEKTERGLEADGLSRVLTNERHKAEAATGVGGLLSQVLDRDGDGSMADDIADLGGQMLSGKGGVGGLLGGLLGGKR